MQPSQQTKNHLSEYRFSKEESFRIAARALPDHQARQLLNAARQKIEMAKNIANSQSLIAFYQRIIELVELGAARVREEFLATDTENS